MSTQPIVIQITDGVDSGIAGKIKAIGLAARQAANDIDNLNAAMGRLSGTQLGNTLGKLAQGLNNVNQPARNAVDSVGRLEGGFARLLSRAVAAEFGIGRMGGAMAGLGITAAGAGPVILAALAIGAVVSAVLVYDKFAKSARDLTEAQTALAEQSNKINDKLLVQKETLIGLVDGPLARYQAELADLSHKSVDVDIDKINKILEIQKSHWADIVAFVQQYVTLVNLASVVRGGIPLANQPTFTIQNAQDFFSQQKLTIAEATDKNKAFNDSLRATGQLLTDVHLIEGFQFGKTKDETEVARNAIQKFYGDLTKDYQVYLNTQKQLRVEAAGETIAEQKQAAADQLKAFNEELNQLKSSGKLVTAQDELALRQAQIAGSPRASLLGPSQPALPFNNGPLSKDVGTLTQEIAKQALTVDTLIKKYQNQVIQSGAYSDALKAEAQYQKFVTDIEGKRIPLTDELRKQLHDIAVEGEFDARVNKEKVQVYQEFIGPLDKYRVALKAIDELTKEGVINEQQAAVARAQSLRSLNDSIDPLNEYKIGLEHEVQLLGQYGKNLQFATEVDRVRQELQRKGYDLDQKSIQLLTEQLQKIDQLKQVQQEENQQYSNNAGALDRLANQQLGLNKAYADGVITLGQYKNQSLETSLAINKLNNEIGGGTLASNVKQIYGELIRDLRDLNNVSHAVTVSLTRDFAGFFKSLEKGFADSIGHALVFKESLSQALIDTARNAVAQLISSLIELGIQYLIVIALQKAFGVHLPKQNDDTKKQIESVGVAIASIAVITAVQLAAINAMMGPAWALAEAVSLFSFGANAAPAEVGIAAVVTAGQVAQHFETGGLVTGTPGRDRIPAFLSNGEFVINARATALNRAALEAINAGAVSSRGGNGASAGGPRVAINVIHDGSTAIAVQQVDESTVRIIAKQEAKAAVQTQAGEVIASEIYNPNSRVSKAVTRNVNAARKR